MTRALLLASALAAGIASAEPTLVAATSGAGVYLYWGDGSAPHAVLRQAGSGPFEPAVRVEPIRDRARVEEFLAAAPDAFSRHLRLAEDFEAAARADPARDRALTLASPGYARVRGAGWLDTAAAPGTSYRYRVLRLEEDGRQVPVGEVEVAAGAPAPRPAPSLQVVAGAARPVLRWSALPFTGYEVQRASAPAGPYHKVAQLPPLPAAEELRWEDDSARADGAALHYRVAPLDLLGQAGPSFGTASAATRDRTAPAAPLGLEARASPAGLRLAWRRSPEPDAAGYRLYRTEVARAGAEGGAAARPGARLNATLLPLGSEEFEDRGAGAGPVHRYEVTAVDRDGNESAPSAPALASLRDAVPPARVAGLRAAAGEGGRVRLSWKAGREEDLWRYRVLAGTGAEGPLRLLAQVAPRPGAKEMTHELAIDPRSEELRRFAVAAVDRFENEGPPSDPVEVRLPDRVPPSGPVLTRLDAADGAVELAWASAGEPDLAGHHVWRAERGREAQRLTAKPLPASARAYRDAAARPGVVYLYAVSALDAAGNEGSRSEARSTSTFRAARPPPPAGLSARPGKGADRLLLEWKPAPGARGALVWQSETREAGWRQLGGLLRQAWLEVARPAQGSTFFRVQILDENGEPSEPTDPLEVRANGTRGGP